MKNEVYLRHIENYRDHWWFQSRKNIIEKIIKKNAKKKKLKILDFGSGSGVNLSMLSKYGHVSIFETHKETQKYLKNLYKGTKFQVINSLNTHKFDLILMADVLEHIKNDKKQIKLLFKKLKKNGKILLTVPAFKSLFTHKDIILGHYRRYNIREIREIFKKFRVLKLTYFNFFLFIPIALSLIFFKILKSNFIDSVEKKPNSIINFILFIIFNTESKVINTFNFPFGISILGLFEKK
mgnify:CR=1 FL=1